MRTFALVAFLCLAAAHSPRAARAAEPFEAELFEPLPSQGINHLQVGASRVLAHLRPSFGLVLHYQTDPYSLSNEDGDIVTDLISDRVTTEVWAALGLFDVLEIGLMMPVILAQSGDDLGAIGLQGSVDGAALRDLRIVPKLQIFRSDGFGLGILGQIFVPTGDQSQFASDGAVRGQVRLLADYEDDGGFALALDAGLDFRPRRQTFTHISEDAVRLGVAVRVPLGVEWLRVLATGHALIPLVPDRDPDNLAIDATNGPDAAVEVDLALEGRFGDFVATVGAGHGLTDGIGAPELRVFALFGYTPADGDRDGDGILDSDDQCPDDPEDFDGFQDKDGCPDPDNDKDGILDVNDKCPNIPEDFDGLGDEDGCPEDDFDGDGILDNNDKCPRVPETKNGFQDEDGCPDELPSITLTEVVYFHTASATIKRESYALLDSIVDLLKAHPEINSLAIDGHADERGNDEYNNALTQRRAASVVDYLAGKGIARDRLTPRGFGEQRPVDPGHDESAWVKNRRVELIVLEMGTKSKGTP